ncbi:hypothetical protein FEM48_Zijuj12G0110700 [Ziziphus jujuba var. spinosa]|uniref:Protein IQ-DOMAIN 1 n=1 Tax=Ziziphus jujuba var. spinosa TaxID=714518 RepID=A0A978UCY1_ZIZJJ|nr:hypothetical protein FEM48_Zijuj12G0110700 [Ziziphus jujuba var. spinosa]
MGIANCFRTIVCAKKSKKDRSKKENSSSELRNQSEKELRNHGRPIEESAASRIQSAFRAFLTKKRSRSSTTTTATTHQNQKCTVRYQDLIQGLTVKEQATAALSYIHSWCRIQEEIRARRQWMVKEARIRQKRLENQLKLDAKLHELEVEWCGGTETMEEIINRIQQREEAAIKRERAMAYAFLHQWRANASQYLGQTSFNVGKENWGWSWVERWVAARPWETRLASHSTNPKKVQFKLVSKSDKIENQSDRKVSVSANPVLSNGNCKNRKTCSTHLLNS